VNFRFLAVPFACLVGLLVVAAPALADEASFLYDPSTVNVIELTLPQEGIEKLEDEPSEYQKGGTVIVTQSEDGSPDHLATPSKTFSNVEIKLKGQPGGSFQGLDGKAAFKLKFKKSELFFGLRKVTLNNMTQDPSMIHESLAYRAFGAAGVPASRAGYAYVWLNGTNYGLHLDIESLDTISLPKIFQVPAFVEPPQHLYEAAEYGADFFADKLSRFEVDEGDEADESDLTALIDAVEAAAPTGSIPPELAEMVDLPEMTRMWAAEKYIGHWDGYAGEAGEDQGGPTAYRPNNYYLYTDASGRFSMLPWGTDQTWESSYHTNYAPLEFDSKDGRLFDLCLEDETCAGLFSTAVANALEKIGGLDLAPKAEATATMLEPWQALEAAPRKPVDSGEIATGVAETVEFIRNRPAEAEAWLAAHPPPSPPDEGGDGAGGGEGGPGSGETGGGNSGGGGETASGSGSAPATPAPAGPPAAEAPSPEARFHGAVRLEGRVLSLHTTLSEPGWLRLDGELGRAGSTGSKACVGQPRSLSAGSHRASCRLSRSAWRRLRSEPLTLTLRATFEGTSGGLGSPTRTVTVRR
jgi:uncharacterized membrane protein YgcG